MVFFIPVIGSNRATALANEVNEYNDTKSCDAEGRDGGCSTVNQSVVRIRESTSGV